ncbi:type II toxin-antitoxin system PemK/MazF family toxin [Oscillatoria sp. CS-180]|uniref:type II toxin-antitoxin system PemK/MazF family toxin n=1 Tax=Oscillatoria sp. CS-180 TaxID=3021720 RepID=UPI00232B942F|nr:type II toxin-antitoxin system PemK/MazF family toxin [Oscillatoria sp. CS-180]MDB9528407.1 type II toxin-antitoxin system PemK/MazF family toxin [Oscillatoria sp. CS-180]
MSLKRFDVVLVPFPFTDLSHAKLRPAVVLYIRTQTDDITLCFISSRHLDVLESDEILILGQHPDYPATGLKLASKIRVSKLLTVSESTVQRRLGYLGDSLKMDLQSRLREIFEL